MNLRALFRRFCAWLEDKPDFPPLDIRGFGYDQPITRDEAAMARPRSYADEVEALRAEQEAELEAAADRALAAHPISNVEVLDALGNHKTVKRRRKVKLASVPK